MLPVMARDVATAVVAGEQAYAAPAGEVLAAVGSSPAGWVRMRPGSVVSGSAVTSSRRRNVKGR